MPKRGQTQPYKTVYQYPECRQWTIPCSSVGDAESRAGDIARQGGDATVYYQAEQGKTTTRVQLSRFGPDVQHVITVIGDRYVCTCGSKGGRRLYESMPGADHAWNARPVGAE